MGEPPTRKDLAISDARTWVLLLRGINVGGRNVLRMGELVQLLDSLGLEEPRTYIQSGNVTFRSSKQIPAELGERIAAAIEERHSFRPHVLVMDAERLESAIERNPFPEAEAEPRTLHLFFLAGSPTAPDLESLNEAKAASERFQLAEDVFYLHAPDGIGRSKLAANVERYLGVAATARNWRTVQKLREMAGTG